MSWIKLGLQDVLYDPKTGEMFAPNTGNRTILGERASGGREETPSGESEDDPAPPGEMEQRGNGRNYIKGPDGRFMGSRPDVGNSDSVPVPVADYMGQPVPYQETVPGRNKPLKIKAYQNESYGNFWCQTNSKNSQALCAYLDRIINEEKRYGEIDRIVVAKHKSLQGVAAYDHLSNRFFVSEERIDETRFSEICDSGYFAAQCLDDVLMHELGGHKAHWDAVKRY